MAPENRDRPVTLQLFLMLWAGSLTAAQSLRPAGAHAPHELALRAW
jgi:hypothetical protein